MILVKIVRNQISRRINFIHAEKCRHIYAFKFTISILHLSDLLLQNLFNDVFFLISSKPVKI